MFLCSACWARLCTRKQEREKPRIDRRTNSRRSIFRRSPGAGIDRRKISDEFLFVALGRRNRPTKNSDEKIAVVFFVGVFGAAEPTKNFRRKCFFVFPGRKLPKTAPNEKLNEKLNEQIRRKNENKTRKIDKNFRWNSSSGFSSHPWGCAPGLGLLCASGHALVEARP